MRSFGSILWSLLVVIVLAGIGVGIYNAGLQQGIAQSATLPAGTVPYYAYGAYGWHGGGGIFGLLFPILFLFILFGIARAAFGHRRGWGHGYGPGYGKWGSGPRWMGSQSSGTGSPRDQWVADMHRRLHEAEGTSPSGAGPAAGGGSGTASPGTGTPGTPPAS